MPSYTFPNGEYRLEAGGPSRCGSCQEELKAGATVCPKCRCFQGWRWWARLIGLNLPWYLAVGTLLANYEALEKNKHDKALQDMLESQKLSVGVWLSLGGASNDQTKEDAQIYVENHLSDASIFTKSIKIDYGGRVSNVIFSTPQIITPGIRRLYDLRIEKPQAQSCNVTAAVFDVYGRSAETQPLHIQ